MVFPVGDIKSLAVGKNSTSGFEGADVCKWLTDVGVTCILVKYRVPNTGCNWNRETRTHEAPEATMALQDAQRAISIVRHHAIEFGIEPDKIGVTGVSAGGKPSVLYHTAFHPRPYAPVPTHHQATNP